MLTQVTRRDKVGLMFPSRHGVPVDDRLVQLYRNHLLPYPEQLNSKDRAEVNDILKDAMLEISRHPKELQSAIITLLENTAADKTHHAFLLDALTDEVPVTVLNEYISYHEHMDRRINRLLLGSLRHYPQLPQADDYSLVSDTVREQISAIFTVTKELFQEANYRSTVHRKTLGRYDPDFDHGLPCATVTPQRIAHGLNRAHVITGDELVQFIMDNPVEADRIAQIIIERSTGDAGFIGSIINGDAAAVSEGTL